MKYKCLICGYIYDNEKENIPFEELPDTWTCPICGAPKNMFELVKEGEEKIEEPKRVHEEETEEELSFLELSILMSNLARGEEKQYNDSESELFKELATNLKSAAQEKTANNIDEIIEKMEEDINILYENAKKMSNEHKDRGALRALTWGEKVTRMNLSLLTNFKKEGIKMFEGKKIWLCTICGFIYIGEKLPDICPVCKVPNWKFEMVGETNE